MKTKEKLEKILKDKYGYDSFKPIQLKIIKAIIKGNDVCGILPTGFGKSLTFQMPGLYMEQAVIVVSPLISLMEDQVFHLREMGLTACTYNSSVENRDKMRSEIINNKYQFIYITPETIINSENMLKKLNKYHGICLIAIDEAHCISSYGNDFRSSYRQLNCLRDMLPETPILAVTATATPNVIKDIKTVLRMDEPIEYQSSFDRPNLYLSTKTKTDKDTDLLPIVTNQENLPCIIYCTSRKDCEKMSEYLRNKGIYAAYYHAGMETSEKTSVYESFIKDKIDVVAATIAFGMGIDKSNVRSVIHYSCPKNIEGYYQEIGRAGRDGQDSRCYLFYNKQDIFIQRRMISNNDDNGNRDYLLGLHHEMVRYIGGNTCKRACLLAYFNETFIAPCDNCNICVKETKKVKINKDVGTESSEIFRMLEEKSFKRNLLVDIIRGANNKDTLAYRKASYFGYGEGRSKEWWNALIDALIKFGYIMLKNENSITLTKKGQSWINNVDLFDETAELKIKV
jgi:RecQ family ATP-dependent DNA helicase